MIAIWRWRQALFNCRCAQAATAPTPRQRPTRSTAHACNPTSTTGRQSTPRPALRTTTSASSPRPRTSSGWSVSPLVPLRCLAAWLQLAWSGWPVFIASHCSVSFCCSLNRSGVCRCGPGLQRAVGRLALHALGGMERRAAQAALGLRAGRGPHTDPLALLGSDPMETGQIDCWFCLACVA